MLLKRCLAQLSHSPGKLDTWTLAQFSPHICCQGAQPGCRRKCRLRHLCILVRRALRAHTARWQGVCARP
jgi:hypothetical protein